MAEIDDAASLRLLEMMDEDRTIIIRKVDRDHHTYKGDIQIGRVCSKRLQKLVKAGKLTKSNIDEYKFVSR